MGSGEQATLNLTGDNFLQVAVPTNTKTADGQALVDVSGKVSAAGGLVQLKAATVARAIRNAVNVPGELSVSSARASGGSIILSGGAGGNVAVSGKLAASGLGKGGTIAVSGRNARLESRNARREQRRRAGRVGHGDGNECGLSRVDGGRRLRRDGRRRDPDRRRFPWRERHHVGSDDDDQLGLDAERERHGLGQRRDGRRVVDRSHLRSRLHLGAGRPTGRQRRSGRDLRRESSILPDSRSTPLPRTASRDAGCSTRKI